MELWASWSSEWHPWPWQGNWNQMIFKVLSNPNHFVIPLFHPWIKCLCRESTEHSLFWLTICIAEMLSTPRTPYTNKWHTFICFVVCCGGRSWHFLSPLKCALSQHKAYPQTPDQASLCGGLPGLVSTSDENNKQAACQKCCVTQSDFQSPSAPLHFCIVPAHAE